MVKNIKDLKEGRSTETPLYDFRKSGRYAYKTMAPPESRIVIVEGTYALHEELRPYFDFKVSACTRTCLARFLNATDYAHT